MFLEHTGDLAGIRVEGSGGKRFPHRRHLLGAGEVALVPFIRLRVLSDRLPGVWCPRTDAAEVKLDTGADSNYLHDSWLDTLGIRDDSNVTNWPRDASGRLIKAKKKLVRIRVVGFEDYVFPIWINYGRRFRNRFFNLSLAALVPYFRIVLTPEDTILYLPGRNL